MTRGMARWDYLIEVTKKPHKHEKCLECDAVMPASARSDSKYCTIKCQREARNKRSREDSLSPARKCVREGCDAAVDPSKRADASYCSKRCLKLVQATTEKTKARKRLSYHNSPEYRKKEISAASMQWAKDNPEKASKNSDRRRRVVQGRVCLSCGYNDGEFRRAGRPFGAGRAVCARCSRKKRRVGVCVTGVHALPPLDSSFEAGVGGQRPHDFPRCMCVGSKVNPDYAADPTHPRRIPFQIGDVLASWQTVPAWRNFTPRVKESLALQKKTMRKKASPGESRRGASGKSPRRRTRGGSTFDIGPRNTKNV